MAASWIVGFITELQWYDALGYRDFYTTRLTLEWTLGLGSFILAFAYLAVNVAIALRSRTGSALRAVGIRRSIFRGPAGWISLGASAVVSLLPAGGPVGPWPSLPPFPP